MTQQLLYLYIPELEVVEKSHLENLVAYPLNSLADKLEVYPNIAWLSIRDRATRMRVGFDDVFETLDEATKEQCLEVFGDNFDALKIRAKEPDFFHALGEPFLDTGVLLGELISDAFNTSYRVQSFENKGYPSNFIVEMVEFGGGASEDSSPFYFDFFYPDATIRFERINEMIVRLAFSYYNSHYYTTDFPSLFTSNKKGGWLDISKKRENPKTYRDLTKVRNEQDFLNCLKTHGRDKVLPFLTHQRFNIYEVQSTP